METSEDSASPPPTGEALDGRCRVLGCDKEMALERKYYQRHMICEEHLKSLCLVVDGERMRFCQQCARLHDISQFQGERRSCRARLKHRNKRRIIQKQQRKEEEERLRQQQEQHGEGGSQQGQEESGEAGGGADAAGPSTGAAARPGGSKDGPKLRSARGLPRARRRAPPDDAFASVAAAAEAGVKVIAAGDLDSEDLDDEDGTGRQRRRRRKPGPTAMGSPSGSGQASGRLQAASPPPPAPPPPAHKRFLDLRQVSAEPAGPGAAVGGVHAALEQQGGAPFGEVDAGLLDVRGAGGGLPGAGVSTLLGEAGARGLPGSAGAGARRLVAVPPHPFSNQLRAPLNLDMPTHDLPTVPEADLGRGLLAGAVLPARGLDARMPLHMAPSPYPRSGTEPAGGLTQGHRQALARSDSLAQPPKELGELPQRGSSAEGSGLAATIGSGPTKAVPHSGGNAGAGLALRGSGGSSVLADLALTRAGTEVPERMLQLIHEEIADEGWGGGASWGALGRQSTALALRMTEEDVVGGRRLGMLMRQPSQEQVLQLRTLEQRSQRQQQQQQQMLHQQQPQRQQRAFLHHPEMPHQQGSLQSQQETLLQRHESFRQRQEALQRQDALQMLEQQALERQAEQQRQQQQQFQLRQQRSMAALDRQWTAMRQQAQAEEQQLHQMRGERSMPIQQPLQLAELPRLSIQQLQQQWQLGQHPQQRQHRDQEQEQQGMVHQNAQDLMSPDPPDLSWAAGGLRSGIARRWSTGPSLHADEGAPFEGVGLSPRQAEYFSARAPQTQLQLRPGMQPRHRQHQQHQHQHLAVPDREVQDAAGLWPTLERSGREQGGRLRPGVHVPSYGNSRGDASSMSTGPTAGMYGADGLQARGADGGPSLISGQGYANLGAAAVMTQQQQQQQQHQLDANTWPAQGGSVAAGLPGVPGLSQRQGPQQAPGDLERGPGPTFNGGGLYDNNAAYIH